MEHSVIINDSNRVLEKMDDLVKLYKDVKGVIETTSGIADMNLAIGGLNGLFASMIILNDDVDDAIKIVEEVKESIDGHCREFERRNEGLTF